jgi:hypothetical protein
MNKLVWLICLATVTAWGQSRLVFAWKPNPSNTKTWPACSKSVKTMCRTGYTLTDVTTTSAPVIISSTIGKEALTYTLTPLPSAGLHIYNLVVDGNGSSGAAVHSAPATVKVDVPAPGTYNHKVASSSKDRNRTSSLSNAVVVIARGGLCRRQ